MKTTDTLPVTSPATLDAPPTPALGLHSGSVGENNKLNVPGNGRRPSRISNRLVFDDMDQQKLAQNQFGSHNLHLMCVIDI